jgi:hypothetical protein
VIYQEEKVLFTPDCFHETGENHYLIVRLRYGLLILYLSRLVGGMIENKALKKRL